jgi:hypothetical protein
LAIILLFFGCLPYSCPQMMVFHLILPK